MVGILSLDFKFRFFPGVGVGVGRSDEIKIKAYLIPAELELGMTLAKIILPIFYIIGPICLKIADIGVQLKHGDNCVTALENIFDFGKRNCQSLIS